MSLVLPEQKPEHRYSLATIGKGLREFYGHNRGLVKGLGLSALALGAMAFSSHPDVPAQDGGSGGLIDTIINNPARVMVATFIWGLGYGTISGGAASLKSMGKMIEGQDGNPRKIGLTDAFNFTVRSAIREGFEWVSVGAIASLALGYIWVNMENLLRAGALAVEAGTSVNDFLASNQNQLANILTVTVLGASAAYTNLRQAIEVRSNILPV